MSSAPGETLCCTLSTVVSQVTSSPTLSGCSGENSNLPPAHIRRVKGGGELYEVDKRGAELIVVLLSLLLVYYKSGENLLLMIMEAKVMIEIVRN